MSLEKTYSHQDFLISAFSSEYLEKLFYFCLKKTNNRQEAEDLASDIALNIISELKKGTIPDRFSAWVWKIAHNRYYVWAKKKNAKNNAVSGDDIEDSEVCGESFELELVHGEDLKLLRRELSFISKDYRDIVVAFYIDDLKVRTIAQMLNLPENTVMSKLHRSRKILKEGMNMAREFGVRSYKPEDVNFMRIGAKPNNIPWNVIQRQLPKNILLQANNNPSTIEELSMEIGIAMPYMEEEVKILADTELLKEVNGKYVTNFFISDKECHIEIYNAQRKQSKERSKILDEIINDKMPEIRTLGIVEKNISDNDFKWLLIPMILDVIPDLKFDLFKMLECKEDANWGIMGIEQHNLIFENLFMTIMRFNENNVAIMKYNYEEDEIGIGNKINLIQSNTLDLFADIMQNNRNANSFTESEKLLWEDLKYICHIDENGNIIPDIVIFKGHTKQKMFDIIKSHAKYAQLENMIYSLFNEVEKILKKSSNPVLHEQLCSYVRFFMYEIRKMALHDEVEAGRLTVPKNAGKSTAGMYLEIK
ncbi:MAG: sigma-70 family RNA polymerase sigma factor [Oscillospiraceae bacterium]|nr:sigma-70 family RNA polymerase sigma factor [Oscillospiraceae bacterium]